VTDRTNPELVIVLDFGAQYAQLIARKVRQCNVYCELLPHDTPLDELAKRQPWGVILSGGPDSVYAPGAPVPPRELFELGIPILGICYGMQLMCHLLGGSVTRGIKREYGKADLEVLSDADLFRGLPQTMTCWMSHGDSVATLPDGFHALGKTANTAHAAVADTDRRFYGVQFHPEMDTDYVGVLIRQRADAIREEGLDPDALLAGLRESDDGPALLARFGAFVRGERS